MAPTGEQIQKEAIEQDLYDDRLKQVKNGRLG
jgi:hypothetical protein